MEIYSQINLETSLKNTTEMNWKCSGDFIEQYNGKELKNVNWKCNLNQMSRLNMLCLFRWNNSEVDVYPLRSNHYNMQNNMIRLKEKAPFSLNKYFSWAVVINWGTQRISHRKTNSSVLNDRGPTFKFTSQVSKGFSRPCRGKKVIPLPWDLTE